MAPTPLIVPIVAIAGRIVVTGRQRIVRRRSHDHGRWRPNRWRRGWRNDHRRRDHNGWRRYDRRKTEGDTDTHAGLGRSRGKWDSRGHERESNEHALQIPSLDE